MSNACEYKNIEFKLRRRITEDGQMEIKVCIEVDGIEVTIEDSLEDAVKWFDYQNM